MNHRFRLAIFAASVFAMAATSAAAISPQDPPETKIKVFLLAGQSNMDGRGDGSKLTDEDKARLAALGDRVQLAYNHGDIVPLGVTTPLPHIARKFELESTFGPEVFFGLSMAEAWPDDEILLIKRSLGGTSLYGCWNPDWTAEKAALMNETERPKLYSDLVAYVHSTLGEYSEGEYEIAGMLWVQGEADSGVKKYGPLPATSYGENLTNLITSIRRDTSVPDLPFFMLQVGGGAVVEGMQETASSVPNVFFIPQSKDPNAANYLPGYGPPIGHYNYEGMKRIGNLFSEAVLGYFGAD